jgi:hypothetical protein
MQIYEHMRTAAMMLIAFAGFWVAGWVGWSLLEMIVALFVADILFLLILHLYHRYRNPWHLRYRRFSRRLVKGDEAAHATVIAELEAQRAAGVRPLETTLMLAAAYSYTGRGAEAEPLADEVISIVIARGLCDKRDIGSRLMCQYARFARFDAWSTQGRFAEAAHSLRPGASTALHPEFTICVIAWGFFLAGDDYNAQIVLEQLKMPRRRSQQKTKMSPHFLLMLAFMRWRLLGENTRDDLRTFRAAFAFWEHSVTRHADNPYGARLREIVEELRPLIATPRAGGGLG